MEDRERDVICVALHRLYTALTEIVPNPYSFVIASGHEVRFVGTWVKVDVVDAFLIGIHGEIGRWGAERPHFYCPIKARGRECVGIFGVDGYVHNVVRVTFVRLKRTISPPGP